DSRRNSLAPVGHPKILAHLGPGTRSAWLLPLATGAWGCQAPPLNPGLIMRFVYSLIRLIPNAARGEFINLVTIVGCEATEEWKMRIDTQDQRSRVKALHGQVPLHMVHDFLSDIERTLDEADAGATEPLRETWLNGLSELYRGIVRVTPPT